MRLVPYKIYTPGKHQILIVDSVVQPSLMSRSNLDPNFSCDEGLTLRTEHGNPLVIVLIVGLVTAKSPMCRGKYLTRARENEKERKEYENKADNAAVASRRHHFQRNGYLHMQVQGTSHFVALIIISAYIVGCYEILCSL